MESQNSMQNSESLKQLKEQSAEQPEDWLAGLPVIRKEGISVRMSLTDQFGMGCTGKVITGTDQISPEACQWGNLDLHLPGDKAMTRSNRQTLAGLTLPLDRWTVARQQHTDTILRVRAEEAGRGSLVYEEALGPADALCTTQPDLLLGVFTADCIGLILTDPSVPSVAVIHSGWKGTAQAIVRRSVQFMKKEGILHPEKAQAWFTPSLQKQSLEVGLEVVEAMENMASKEQLDLEGCILPHDNPAKRYIDNQELCVRMLLTEGFQRENIHESLQDTRSDETCFSYRRDGLLGEHFTFAWIRSKSESKQ